MPRLPGARKWWHNAGVHRGRRGVFVYSVQVLRCLGAVNSITTFIRDMSTLLQIRQFAHLRTASCSLQGLSPARRFARAAPSGDLALGVMHLPWLEEGS